MLSILVYIPPVFWERTKQLKLYPKVNLWLSLQTLLSSEFSLCINWLPSTWKSEKLMFLLCGFILPQTYLYLSNNLSFVYLILIISLAPTLHYGLSYVAISFTTSQVRLPGTQVLKLIFTNRRYIWESSWYVRVQDEHIWEKQKNLNYE